MFAEPQSCFRSLGRWCLFRPRRHAVLSFAMHQQSVIILHRYIYNQTFVESCRFLLFCYLRWSTNHPSRPFHTLHAHFSGKTVVQYNIVCFSPVRAYQACKQSSHIHTVQRLEIPWILPNAPYHRCSVWMVSYTITSYEWLRIPSVVMNGFVHHYLYSSKYGFAYHYTSYSTWFCIPSTGIHGIVYHCIHGIVYHPSLYMVS